MTTNFAFDNPFGRGRLAAAGIVPALTWTAAVFAVQTALYGLWFGNAVFESGRSSDELFRPLMVLVVVTPLFDAAVFISVFLIAYPVLRGGGRPVVGIPLLIAANSASIAAGALALVGAGCHAALGLASLPAIAAAAAGVVRHERVLRRIVSRDQAAAWVP